MGLFVVFLASKSMLRYLKWGIVDLFRPYSSWTDCLLWKLWVEVSPSQLLSLPSPFRPYPLRLPLLEDFNILRLVFENILRVICSYGTFTCVLDGRSSCRLLICIFSLLGRLLVRIRKCILLIVNKNISPSIKENNIIITSKG